MRLVTSTFLSVGLIATAGCKEAGSSQLEHIFGKTQRSPISDLEDCSPPDAGASLPLGDKYVAAIAHHIMNANPETFRGHYAPEKFCFYVVDGETVNAFANPKNRSITFYSAMLGALPNDAEVAAIMAHELAHVTMQHSGDYESDEVAADPRWQSRGPDLKQRLISLGQQHNDLSNDQAALYAEQEILENALEAALAGNVKDMRFTLEAQYDAILNELNEKLVSSGDGNLAFFRLAMMLQAPTPRQILLQDVADAVESSQAPDFNSLRAKIIDYNTRRDTWVLAEKQEFPEIWKKYDDLKMRADLIGAQFDAAYTAYTEVAHELHELRTMIIGDAAGNWAEKEADDVGLEFYLRAGFAPLHYYDMFNVLEASIKPGAVSCVIQNAAGAPERGSGSHPSSCWRYYNAKALEMIGHAEEYAPFLSSAIKTEILPGQLQNLKKSFSTSKYE